jgi:hypothetical protein
VASARLHLVAEALDGAADVDDTHDGAVVPQDRGKEMGFEGVLEELTKWTETAGRRPEMRTLGTLVGLQLAGLGPPKRTPPLEDQ